MTHVLSVAYWISAIDADTRAVIGCMKVLFHAAADGSRLAEVPATGFHADEATEVWLPTLDDFGNWHERGVRATPLGLAMVAAQQALAELIGRPVRSGPMTQAWRGDPRHFVVGMAAASLIAVPDGFFNQRSSDPRRSTQGCLLTPMHNTSALLDTKGGAA